MLDSVSTHPRMPSLSKAAGKEGNARNSLLDFSTAPGEEFVGPQRKTSVRKYFYIET